MGENPQSQTHSMTGANKSKPTFSLLDTVLKNDKKGSSLRVDTNSSSGSSNNSQVSAIPSTSSRLSLLQNTHSQSAWGTGIGNGPSSGISGMGTTGTSGRVSQFVFHREESMIEGINANTNTTTAVAGDSKHIYNNHSNITSAIGESSLLGGAILHSTSSKLGYSSHAGGDTEVGSLRGAIRSKLQRLK